MTAWVRSSKRNVDLQATITEVRPDGKETFVQNGWVRAKERKLDKAKSRPLEPVLSLRKSDARSMPHKRYAKVVIPLYYEGHAYRAGSRIRVTISAPGGDQPIWAFAETSPRKGGASVWIAHSRKRPSRLVLPVVGGDIPTGLPACPGLRGEPCRPYGPSPTARCAAAERGRAALAVVRRAQPQHGFDRSPHVCRPIDGQGAAIRGEPRPGHPAGRVDPVTVLPYPAPLAGARRGRSSSPALGRTAVS